MVSFWRNPEKCGKIIVAVLSQTENHTLWSYGNMVRSWVQSLISWSRIWTSCLNCYLTASPNIDWLVFSARQHKIVQFVPIYQGGLLAQAFEDSQRGTYKTIQLHAIQWTYTCNMNKNVAYIISCSLSTAQVDEKQNSLRIRRIEQ